MIIWTIITGVLIIRVDRTKFDVITHQTVKVHRDRSFAGPRQGLTVQEDQQIHLIIPYSFVSIHVVTPNTFSNSLLRVINRQSV